MMCFTDLEFEFETVDTGNKEIHCIRVRYVTIAVQPLVLFVCIGCKYCKITPHTPYVVNCIPIHAYTVVYQCSLLVERW